MQLRKFVPTLPDKTGELVIPDVWLNPRTGKGWSDREEEIIAQIMADESCTRIAAIQAMRRRTNRPVTDLPCGLKAVREHMEHRGNTRLPMNVSAEADAVYIAEKRLRVGPVILKSWPIGTCSRCHGAIHDAPFLSNEPGQFCSHACRDAGIPDVRRGRPHLTPKQRKESKAKRLAYQKNLMQKRRDSALANNCPQPFENAKVADAISGV
jgi:hypothetical protein